MSFQAGAFSDKGFFQTEAFSNRFGSDRVVSDRFNATHWQRVTYECKHEDLANPPDELCICSWCIEIAVFEYELASERAESECRSCCVRIAALLESRQLAREQAWQEEESETDIFHFPEAPKTPEDLTHLIQ